MTPRMPIEFAMKRTTEEAPDQVEARIRSELQKVGFGILTEIDVKAVFKAKLDHDIEPYKILGACNPNFAREGLAAEPDLGTLLPCNVCIYVENGRTVVSAMKPTAALSLVDHPVIARLATEVEKVVWEALSAAVPDAVQVSGAAT
jgi:uncharacterized protein (DUF302 family)